MRLKEFVQETGGSTGNFLKIDPRLLKVRPGFNIRDLTTPAARQKLDILKAQIKAEGVLEALEIEFDGETPWINEGHRRHLMVMELIAEGEDIKTVPCVQERQGTDAAKRNLHMLMRKKEEYEPLEYAAGIARQINVYGWDKANLARSLGFKSKASIESYLDMLAMSPAIKDQIREGTVSATVALKVSRDTQTPEELKAKIIADAAEEQRRLGKKGKATPKALKAASERAKPKVPAEPKAPEQTKADTPEQTGAPVEGVTSIDHLKDQIAGLTSQPAPTAEELREYHRPPDGATAVTANPADAAAAEQRRRDEEFESAAPTPLRGPRPHNPVDSILCSMIAASNAAELAFIWAKLDREHDEASAEGQDTDAQVRLVEIADNVGHVRFPDDWENAKASSELQQVA